MNNFTLHKDVSIEFETPDNLSFKFGYYNYSPLNKNGDKLLAHKIDFEGRLPLKDDEIEIGFFDLNKLQCVVSQRVINKCTGRQTPETICRLRREVYFKPGKNYTGKKN